MEDKSQSQFSQNNPYASRPASVNNPFGQQPVQEEKKEEAPPKPFDPSNPFADDKPLLEGK